MSRPRGFTVDLFGNLETCAECGRPAGLQDSDIIPPMSKSDRDAVIASMVRAAGLDDGEEVLIAARGAERLTFNVGDSKAALIEMAFAIYSLERGDCP